MIRLAHALARPKRMMQLACARVMGSYWRAGNDGGVRTDFAKPSQGPAPLRSQSSGSAAAARSERSRARRVAASTVANRQVRRHRVVAHVSPRPSACGGAAIERRFGQTRVRAKAVLKVWSCRRETSLHCDRALGDCVTPAASSPSPCPDQVVAERHSALARAVFGMMRRSPLIRREPSVPSSGSIGSTRRLKIDFFSRAIAAAR
jgi:hypothetical protein